MCGSTSTLALFLSLLKYDEANKDQAMRHYLHSTTLCVHSTRTLTYTQCTHTLTVYIGTHLLKFKDTWTQLSSRQLLLHCYNAKVLIMVKQEVWHLLLDLKVSTTGFKCRLDDPPDIREPAFVNTSQVFERLLPNC